MNYPNVAFYFSSNFRMPGQTVSLDQFLQQPSGPFRIWPISTPSMPAHFWPHYTGEETAAQMTPKVITGTRTSPCHWCTDQTDKLDKMHIGSLRRRFYFKPGNLLLIARQIGGSLANQDGSKLIKPGQSFE